MELIVLGCYKDITIVMELIVLWNKGICMKNRALLLTLVATGRGLRLLMHVHVHVHAM